MQPRAASEAGKERRREEGGEREKEREPVCSFGGRALLVSFLESGAGATDRQELERKEGRKELGVIVFGGGRKGRAAPPLLRYCTVVKSALGNWI